MQTRKIGYEHTMKPVLGGVCRGSDLTCPGDIAEAFQAFLPAIWLDTIHRGALHLSLNPNFCQNPEFCLIPVRRLNWSSCHGMSRSAITVLILIVLSAIGVAAIAASGGVSVVVQNKGPETISDVTVHVTGSSYEIGALKPGQTRKVRVTPKGESHVEIAFLDSSHNQHRVVADCYFDKRHFKGTITIDIAANEVSRVDEATELSLF